jgi:hypothetical protein
MSVVAVIDGLFWRRYILITCTDAREGAMPGRQIVARWIAPVVAGLAILAAVSGCASSPSPAAAATQSYDGHRWRVVHVEHIDQPRSSLAVPASKHPWIAFNGRGRLTAYDLVDHYTLSYRSAAGGFTPSGYKGSAGWTVSRSDLRTARYIASVLGDHWHPVMVTSTSPVHITMTAYYHRSGDQSWHPTVAIDCVRDET